jgi:regulator of protease activity HflC (stomatin/prohibitin superfamily)
VIDFLKGRAQRQAEAGEHIRQALDKYNVQAVDTLIGDIHPPEALMKTLTDRKVAEQSKVTFAIQQQAEEQRQEFQRAKSEADTRSQIVAASRAAEVAKLNADAAVNAARGEADAKKIIAEGQATYTKVTGEADASKTKMVGEAEAGVLKLKVESVGPQFYAAMNIFDRLAENKTALVPQIVAGIGTGEKASGGSGSGIIDALLGVVLAQQLRGQNLQSAEEKVLTGMAVALSSGDSTSVPVSDTQANRISQAVE